MQRGGGSARRGKGRGRREEGEACSATREEDAYGKALHFGLVQNTGTYLL